LKRDLPAVAAGQRIGLLGGSFDPPHAGHIHISLQALRGFGLDRVWWLVSPGNPLKADAPSDLTGRMAACAAIIDDARIEATDIEAQLGTRYTAETLHKLLPFYPQVKFVWLMGADNLAGFHRWQDWRGIMAMVPVGVLPRPGAQEGAMQSVAALEFANHRLSTDMAASLSTCKPPCWTLLSGPTVDISSTEIRKKGVHDL